MILTLNFKNAFFSPLWSFHAHVRLENGHKDVLHSLSTPKEKRVDSSNHVRVLVKIKSLGKCI